MRIVCLCLVSLLVTACAVVTPHQDADDFGALSSEGEARLRARAVKADRAIRKSDQLYQDDALQLYLQGVLDKLYPDFAGTFHVRILGAPLLNAFAMPNGSIYINAGMLAVLQNEAQLAAVLGHEGVHVVNRHSALQRMRVNQSVAAALFLPGLGNMLAMSSISGYSRALEQEADQEGFARLAAAGYQPSEGAEVFRRLLAEAELEAVSQPFFFASHPALEQRIANYAQYSAKHGKVIGRLGTKTYRARVRKLRLHVLEAQIGSGQFTNVIYKFKDDKLPPGYPPQALFWLGEAYRLRADKGDGRRALKIYKRSLKRLPKFAPPYRSLGVHYLRQGKMKLARRHFQRYLALSPEASDRRYIENYIARTGRR